jgi:hypothetical protein
MDDALRKQFSTGWGSPRRMATKILNACAWGRLGGLTASVSTADWARAWSTYGQLPR